LRADVYSTDIDEYFVNEYATLRYSERIPASRFHIGVEDGRLLSFPSDFFDRVYSISVIEHIPGTGDTECLREIARVLRSGGLCLLTVPFGTTSRDIYRPRKDFYWASSSTGAGDELVFFQRRYTEEDLSGLHVKRLQYIGESILARSPKEFYEVLSGIIQVLTGSVQAVFAKMLLTEPVDSWR
jgi:ubiquinone/menaquinone biosynthesis C-methylase UbiE